MNEIQREAQTSDHALVMSSIMIFNKAVLKTNFYQPTKVAVSFRMNPSFLSKWEYPVGLYGMFLVIGNEFRGFHLRFRDVARGGIRIVKSRSKEAYALNARKSSTIPREIDKKAPSSMRTIILHGPSNVRIKISRKEVPRASSSSTTTNKTNLPSPSKNTSTLSSISSSPANPRELKISSSIYTVRRKSSSWDPTRILLISSIGRRSMQGFEVRNGGSPFLRGRV